MLKISYMDFVDTIHSVQNVMLVVDVVCGRPHLEGNTVRVYRVRVVGFQIMRSTLYVGARGSTVVEVLRYKPDSRGIESR
jgi:hypothetical protein